MRFNQFPRCMASIDGLPEGESIKGLPQFFRADMDMVWRLGGEIYRAVINQLGFASRWKYLSIDSRSSMLMPGMFPCIPGWHCDDFYRPDGRSPDLLNLEKNAPSEHAMLLIGDCSKTEFLDTVLDWEPRAYGGIGLYARAHEAIEKMRKESTEARSLTRLIPPGELTWFSPFSWHRGTPATHAGWRHFLRVTGSNHYEPRNELRTQTQVYVVNEAAGW